jgi:hypothetical protein
MMTRKKEITCNNAVTRLRRPLTFCMELCQLFSLRLCFYEIGLELDDGSDVQSNS